MKQKLEKGKIVCYSAQFESPINNLKGKLMNKRLSLASALLLGAFMAVGTLQGAPNAAKLNPDNPASPAFKKNAAANRAKVEQLAKEAGVKSDILHFTVRPMSEIMRLGDVYPTDGLFNAPIRALAAQGEYEPMSFQLFALNGKKDVTFKISDLKDKKGNVLPAKQLDMKVVKIWYQNGNRWNSYFADVDLRLVPELLLKDENMVKVDTDQVANYARIRKDGKDTYKWISAPKALETGFHAAQKGFEDATELQSVKLDKDQFKQFFVTVHVPEKQVPGIYTGTITINADGKNAGVIPVKVRVLPFELPLPATYQKLDQPVVCSVMGGFYLSTFRNIYKDEKLAMDRYIKALKNAKAHGMFHPAVNQTAESLQILKDLGFPTDGPIMGSNFMPWFARNFGGKLTFDNMMAAKAAAKRTHDFYMKHLGHSKNILTSYGDEQGAAFVIAHRNFHKYFEEYGIRVGCAGHHALFYKGAHTYGVHPMGGAPDSIDRIKRWRDMGDIWVGFYASQHTGSENPAFLRRQNGMLGYLNGANLLDNYEFAIGPWNDLDSVLYKPMVVSYLNYGGYVDTLQWEAYREAVDDMRYCTLLQQEIQKALASNDIEYKTEARKALRFLAIIKPREDDLDSVRSEMIVYILKLRKMANAQKKG